MFIQQQYSIHSLQERFVPAPRLALNRLLATAVVDRQFRCQLLADPARVMDSEYQGRGFLLADDERDSLLSIHASSLQELAQKLLASLEYPSIPVRQASCVRYS